jgi:hypothetical protein
LLASFFAFFPLFYHPLTNWPAFPFLLLFLLLLLLLINST